MVIEQYCSYIKESKGNTKAVLPLKHELIECGDKREKSTRNTLLKYKV